MKSVILAAVAALSVVATPAFAAVDCKAEMDKCTAMKDEAAKKECMDKLPAECAKKN